jgi:dTMP kinase
MFVTFEGVDGSGKTTQVELLRSYLAERGRDVVATREPGGTPLGERVRELLLDGPEMAPWAEAALFAAARAELAERVIRPALARGADVVSDRYVDSSLAYQGIARRLGLERVLELNLLAIGDLLPDRTFVLDVEPELAVGRVGKSRDRIESETDDFRGAVAEGYRSLEAVFPQRVRVLDGSRPASEIARAVREELAALV